MRVKPSARIEALIILDLSVRMVMKLTVNVQMKDIRPVERLRHLHFVPDQRGYVTGTV